jgi:hypothetical protein
MSAGRTRSGGTEMVVTRLSSIGTRCAAVSRMRAVHFWGGRGRSTLARVVQADGSGW